MKLQIKLPELSLGETRQSWPLWLDMWYAMRVTWHHQRFSLSRSQSRNPLKGAWPHMNATRWREGKGPQVNQGNTLNSDAGNFQGNSGKQDKLQVKSRYVVSGYRILTHVNGSETHTISRPCTWGTTSTVSKLTPPTQTLHLGPPDHWLGHQVSAAWAPKVKTSGFL